MRKFLALLAFSFAAVRGEAASVEWDDFTHVETEFDVQADSGKSVNSIRDSKRVRHY